MDERLLGAVRDAYLLDWGGIHGYAHWVRVRETGLMLAERAGARADVVELFAWLHDSRRENDGGDPAHGPRAAAFARELHARGVLVLDASGLALLVEACGGHTRGTTTPEPTVGCCWDADRLDLGRVGKRPDPALLCTAPARDPAVIAWAYTRSLR